MSRLPRPWRDQGHGPGGALRLCSGGDQVLLRDRSAQTVQQGAELVRGPHRMGWIRPSRPGGQYGLEGVLILGGGHHGGPGTGLMELLPELGKG